MASGSIDQLNFEVILDDSKFNEVIKRDLEAAKELNTELTNILNLKKKVATMATKELVDAEKVRQAQEKTAQQTAKTVEQQQKAALAAQKVATEVERTKRAQEGHTMAVKNTNSTLLGTSSIMRTLTQLTGAYFGVAGVRRLLSSMVEITGQFEVQRMALRTMLKDIDGADQIFQDLYRFSSDSTYRFSELAKYAKQLAAFNIEKDSLLETTKMLGDVASGVGASMDRVILAYGHVKTSGFLRGIQLRSFSQNGIPILEELAKILTEVEGKAVSLGEVFDKMTRREITFEMVEEAFKRMTSEGGTFFHMQETLAKTLAGQINILKGRWENLMAAIGDSQSGFLKGVVANISDTISSYDKFGLAIKELIVIYGAYKTAMVAAMVLTNDWAALTELSFVRLTRSALKWIAANPYALIGASVAALTAMIVTAANKTSEWEKITKVADKTLSDFSSSLATENAELDRLYTRLNLATAGTEAYDNAKRAIESRFGPYIQELRNEGIEVSNLATIYQGLKDKIQEATRARSLEAGSQSLKSQFENSSKVIEEEVEKTIAQVGKKLSASQQEVLASYVYGIIDENNPALDGLKNLLRLGNDEGGPQAFGGPGSGRKFTNLQTLRTQYGRILNAYNEGMNKIEDRLKTLESLTETDEGDAQDVGTYKISDLVEGIKKYDADIKKLRDKAVSSVGITEDEKQLLENYIEARDEMAKEYKDLMGVDYDKASGTKKTSSSGKSEAQKQVEARIKLLNTYKDAYKKLLPFFETGNKMTDDSVLSAVLSNIFGEHIDVSSLDDDLVVLADSLAKFGEDAKRYGEDVKAGLGKDAISQKVDELKAIDDFRKAYDKWTENSSLLSGTGAEFDVTKALADHEKALKKLGNEYEETRAKAEKAFDGDTLDEHLKKLKEEYSLAKKNEQTKLTDKAEGIAKKIFEEQMRGYDLSDWGDKTLEDILDIRDALDNVEIPKEIQDALENYPELLAAIKTALDGIVQDTEMNTIDPEVIKKWTDYAKLVAKYLSEAGEAMERLGDATDNVQLAAVGEAIGAIAQNLNAAAEGYASSGSWIGAVVAGAMDIISQTTEAIAKANEETMRLNKALNNARAEAFRLQFKDSLGANTDSVFGDNFVARIHNAVTALGEMDERFASLKKAMSEYRSLSLFGEAFDEMLNKLGVAESFLYSTQLKTKRSFWGDKFKSIASIAKDLGMEVKDQYGNLNPDLLRKIDELYGDLNASARTWLYSAIEYSDAYAEAMQQIEDATEDVFGDLASDMTDQFIDDFLRIGYAVNDLGDIFANLGDTILRNLLQSYILDEILNKYKDRAQEMLSDYAQGNISAEVYASRLDSMLDDIQRDSEANAGAINDMIAAFKDRGLMNLDEDTSNSLGSGIKGITEDTAGLLASYLNAIRADVSVMRGLQQVGWKDVSSILGLLQSPTLNDHIAQTAANTFDIAQSNTRILNELQSVIRSGSSGGMVVMAEVI